MNNTMKKILLNVIFVNMFIFLIGMGGCDNENSMSDLLTLRLANETDKLNIKNRLESLELEIKKEKKTLKAKIDQEIINDKAFNKKVINTLNTIFQEVGKNKNYKYCTEAKTDSSEAIFKKAKYENMKPWIVDDSLKNNAEMILYNLDNLKATYKEGIVDVFSNTPARFHYVYEDKKFTPWMSNQSDKPINSTLKPRPTRKRYGSYVDSGAWISGEMKQGSLVEGISLEDKSKDLDRFLCDRIQDKSPFTYGYDWHYGRSDLYIGALLANVGFIDGYPSEGEKGIWRGIGRKQATKAYVVKKDIGNNKYRVVIYFRSPENSSKFDI